MTAAEQAAADAAQKVLDDAAAQKKIDDAAAAALNNLLNAQKPAAENWFAVWFKDNWIAAVGVVLVGLFIINRK